MNDELDKFVNEAQKEKMKEFWDNEHDNKLWDSKNINWKYEITPDIKEAQEMMSLAILNIQKQINKAQDDHYLLTSHRNFSLPIMRGEGDYTFNFTVICNDCEELRK